MQENKAIVTEIPGTTRDVIEAKLSLGNYILNLIDTAGIRATKDIIEQIGVERSKEKIEYADLILMIFDGSRSLTEEDYQIMDAVKNKKHIYIVNKNGSHPYNINNGLGWVKESDLTPINTTPGNYYTVVRGDTLWGIAKKFYGDGSRYPEIAKANNISNPDLIYAGQKLLIP